MSTLITDAEGAATDKAAEGAAGTEPFDLRSGGILDPPPLAYDLSSSQAGVLGFHLDVWNIEIENNRVLMGQQAQPVIPYLMDPDSPYVIVPAQRVFDLATPIGGVTPQTLAPLVSGSHQLVFEARVLTRYQVGTNPTGIEIPVLGGDVTFDATAQVFATLELETEGLDDRGDSLFPRRASDLLAPYGHEVFVRAGIDTGETILWSPLGYFRLTTDEQPRRSSHPMRLLAPDRMQQIVDSRLVEPVQFDADTTVSVAVSALVTPVYPAVTIVFDNGSGELLGRDVVIEEDRYEGLLDIVESLGKVMYFDGEGVLRIEDAPDPEEIVWELKAGHDGVLVDAGREVSREGMRNGWRATGEGTAESPVVAVVVDTSVTSPTRWDPPDDPFELWFGQIPGYYSSPLLTTGSRARRAAESKLSRHIGMPYRVNFGSVPNVALRPRQATRFTYDDGNRERHLIENLAVPLVADANMTGATREQTLVQIGQL